MKRNRNHTASDLKKALRYGCCLLLTYAVVPNATAEIRKLSDSKSTSLVEVEMVAQQFLKINKERKRNGYHLVDLQAYAAGVRIKYAAVWGEKGSKVIQRSTLKLGLKQRELLSHDSRLRKQGYALQRLGSVSFNGELRYFAEWYRTTRGDSNLQHVEYGVDRTAFEKLDDLYKKSGFELRSFDVVWHLKRPRYSGVWSEGERSSQAVKYDIPEGMLQQHLDRMQNNGFRLQILRSHLLPSNNPQTFYSGVWKKSPVAPR